MVNHRITPAALRERIAFHPASDMPNMFHGMASQRTSGMAITCARTSALEPVTGAAVQAVTPLHHFSSTPACYTPIKPPTAIAPAARSEEHTSDLQSLMRHSNA